MATKKSSGGADAKGAPAEPTCDAPEPPRASPAGAPRIVPAGRTRAAHPFLGHAQAVQIVCKCANTIPANLARTLAELGVNGIPFQQAVRTAINAAGYAIGADDVPGAPGTRLIQVVTIIQNARRSA
jgi:hypothetical protein